MNKDLLNNLRNKVLNEDVFNVLKQLPDGSIDMVYGDPDYNVGVKYGDKTYTKNFDEYIEWYIELARESLRVLKDTGNMFFINYPQQNANLRVKYLDQACYEVSDYVWIYNTNVGHSPKRFTTAHRSILHCRKTKDNTFYKNNVAEPYKNPTDRRIQGNLANGSKGRMPYDWFYFDLVKNVSSEKTFHACQIPQALSELLIKSCTKPEDVVLVLFGGSGAEVEVCKNLGRQFISAEIDPKYHKVIIDRLKNGSVPEKHRLLTYMKEKQMTDAPQTMLFSR
jgi:DNA modification methylase